MRIYRNTRTGLVVHTKGKVTGDAWEPLEELPGKPDSVDKTYDDLDQVEDETADLEQVEDETADLEQVEDETADLEQEEEAAEDQQPAAEAAPTKRTRTRKTK